VPSAEPIAVYASRFAAFELHVIDARTISRQLDATANLDFWTDGDYQAAQ
jgi:hypothetical protein